MIAVWRHRHIEFHIHMGMGKKKTVAMTAQQTARKIYRPQSMSMCVHVCKQNTRKIWHRIASGMLSFRDQVFTVAHTVETCRAFAVGVQTI